MFFLGHFPWCSSRVYTVLLWRRAPLMTRQPAVFESVVSERHVHLHWRQLRTNYGRCFAIGRHVPIMRRLTVLQKHRVPLIQEGLKLFKSSSWKYLLIILNFKVRSKLFRWTSSKLLFASGVGGGPPSIFSATRRRPKYKHGNQHFKAVATF